MSTVYDFDERMAFSKAVRQESDLATLRLMFPACIDVRKTGRAEDVGGVDYVVSLRRGGALAVDGKARDAGCSRWWRNGAPEVALEIWNVRPGGSYATPPSRQKTGWTLDESRNVDLILFTFHPSDHPFAYVRPLPLLRESLRRNFGTWRDRYRSDIQKSSRQERDGVLRWESECVFVPLAVVDQAISDASRARLAPAAGGVAKNQRNLP